MILWSEGSGVAAPGISPGRAVGLESAVGQMVATYPGGPWVPAVVPGGWPESLLHLPDSGLFARGCWAPRCSERAPPRLGGRGLSPDLHHICGTSPRTDSASVEKLTFGGKDLSVTVRKWMQEKGILVTFTNYLMGIGVPQCLRANRQLTKVWIFG